MHSMTGFGRGTSPFEEGQIVLEIKTVNHRFLEIRSRTPNEFIGIEPFLEKLIRKKLHRGHCSIYLSFEHLNTGASQLNTKALESHIVNLKEIAQKQNISLETLIPLLTNAPDLFSLPVFTNTQQYKKTVLLAFDEAMNNLLTMRTSEGSAMSEDIVKKLSIINQTIKTMSKLAEDYAQTLFKRTSNRLEKLLSATDLTIDKSKIEAEAAILADKADINEEITRLKSHCNQLFKQKDTNGSVGRPMEFIIQEMGREANTIGSKTVLPDLAHLVVELKAQLEKIRELVQNVE